MKSTTKTSTNYGKLLQNYYRTIVKWFTINPSVWLAQVRTLGSVLVTGDRKPWLLSQPVELITCRFFLVVTAELQ